MISISAVDVDPIMPYPDPAQSTTFDRWIVRGAGATGWLFDWSIEG